MADELDLDNRYIGQTVNLGSVRVLRRKSPTHLGRPCFNVCNRCNSPNTGTLASSKPQTQQIAALAGESAAGPVRWCDAGSRSASNWSEMNDPGRDYEKFTTIKPACSGRAERRVVGPRATPHDQQGGNTV